LKNHLNTCRHLYNHFLEQLKNHPYLSRYEQQDSLPELKEECRGFDRFTPKFYRWL